MRKQQTGGEGRLALFARHAENSAARADRIIVDAFEIVLLPFVKLEWLADVLTLRDETDLLDERDDIGSGDLVVDGTLSSSHGRGSPTA
jgi:hypothetical protein